MKMPRRPLKRARIEIIPMIDTMFFLLVFFMLASLAMSYQYTLPVNLPQAAGISDKPQHIITLTVTNDEKLFLDKEPIGSPAEAARQLTRRSQGDKQIAVIINADSGVKHGRVVEVMDAVRQSGLQKIAIAVNPTGSSAAIR